VPLKEVTPNRFEAKCVTCLRASPIVSGPQEAATQALRGYTWTQDVEDAWVCPVCLTRTTAKRRKFDPETGG
jgi:hypothetical protein